MAASEHLSAETAAAIRQLAAELAERDWAYREGFLTRERVAVLRAEAESLRAAGRFHPAGIGHMADRREGIRGDDIVWVEESAPLAWQLQQQELTALREACNATLYL